MTRYGLLQKRQQRDLCGPTQHFARGCRPRPVRLQVEVNRKIGMERRLSHDAILQHPAPHVIRGTSLMLRIDAEAHGWTTRPASVAAYGNHALRGLGFRGLSESVPARRSDVVFHRSEP
jgi:hypothetical protein